MTKSMDLFKLTGKVALVTGGSKGIGEHYAQALIEAGARVVVADIDTESVASTTARLEQQYPESTLGMELDVTSRDSIRQVVRAVDEKWGRLDILVNNAGLFSAIPIRESTWDVPEDEWDRVMAVNVRGIYLCVAETLDLLQRSGWGRILNVASGLAFKGSPALIHYAASKGAVVNLTRSMATALGHTGITVNAIAPGGTASATWLAARPNFDPERSTRDRIIKRVEVPADLIGTLLYLVSPASDFVTGQTVVVDGGSYLH